MDFDFVVDLIRVSTLVRGELEHTHILVIYGNVRTARAAETVALVCSEPRVFWEAFVIRKQLKKVAASFSAKASMKALLIQGKVSLL